MEICHCSWDRAYIGMADAVWNHSQTFALPCPGSSKSMIVAKTVLTLSWTMLSHSRIIRTCDYSWDGAYIVMDDALWNRLQTYACCTPITPKSRTVAETILTLSCIMLFAIVCKRTRNPFQDHNKFEIMIMTEMLLTLSWAMQCQIFPKSTHDPPWHHQNLWLWLRQCLIVMDDAIWNRLQTYALPTPEPSQSMIIADTVLKLS